MCLGTPMNVSELLPNPLPECRNVTTMSDPNKLLFVKDKKFGCFGRDHPSDKNFGNYKSSGQDHGWSTVSKLPLWLSLNTLKSERDKLCMWTDCYHALLLTHFLLKLTQASSLTRRRRRKNFRFQTVSRGTSLSLSLSRSRRVRPGPVDVPLRLNPTFWVN